MGVMFRGKMKTRAQLIQEQLEADRQQKILKESQKNYIDLYPKEDRNLLLESHYRKIAFDNFYHHGMDNFQQEVLNELMFQTIYGGIVEPVLEASFANSYQKDLAAKTVVDFINEEGANDLLNKFKYKNFYLAELAEALQETYDLILEDSKDKVREGLTSDEVYKIENDKIDNYLVDVKQIIPKDITNKVSDRVEDAITDFADEMKTNKDKVMEIYNKAQDKINDINGMNMDAGMDPMGDQFTAPTSPDDMMDMQQEAYRTAKRQELAITEADTSVFGAMVKILTESVMTIPALQESYLDESGRVDMPKLLSEARAIYTVLESLNTIGIVEADEEYIAKTLGGMKDSMAKEKPTPTNADDNSVSNQGTMYKPREVTHGNGVKQGTDPMSDFTTNF